MLLSDVAATSAAVAATRSRLAKRALLVALLARAEPADLEIVVSYLSGELRQRRTGVGWASLGSLPAAADEPKLSLVEVDALFERVARLSGPGSAKARAESVSGLLARATSQEQHLLRGLIAGDVRQGALDAAMLDAVAAASEVPLDVVRRAAMLRGATGPVAIAALTGGSEAVAGFGLTVGQPVRPMLAASAPDVEAALARVGSGACLDVKLDGIRIQVHKKGDRVTVFTRSLDDITSRLPEICEIVRRLAPASLILDGEAMTVDVDGRPRPFQETSSRTASQATDHEVGLVTPFFFDVLHADGVDVLYESFTARAARLDEIVPSQYRASRLVTSDPAKAQGFFDATVANGHEGVVVKALGAPYDAGRRGSAWVKVKPRHTLDLVVTAVEWGSGRRHGWLSNIHLAARDPESDGPESDGPESEGPESESFVMLGKTFKGMTDEMLRWQTERFLELEVSRSGHVVRVRPEQVVEVAFDGVQRSSRYPAGLALRFARVVRYRNDKTGAEADTIATVRDIAGLPPVTPAS